MERIANIYKITNNQDDKIFIGQTNNFISGALNRLKKASYRLDNSPLFRHMRHIGADNFYIELIEQVYGDNEYIKNKMIEHIARLKPVLNGKLFGTDEQERKIRINKCKMNYYHAHKHEPRHTEKVKLYYQRHRDDILRKRREKMIEMGLPVYEKKGRPKIKSEFNSEEDTPPSLNDFIILG